jgi:hypothetical protein
VTMARQSPKTRYQDVLSDEPRSKDKCLCCPWELTAYLALVMLWLVTMLSGRTSHAIYIKSLHYRWKG